MALNQGSRGAIEAAAGGLDQSVVGGVVRARGRSMFIIREHRRNAHSPGEDFLPAAEDLREPAPGPASRNNAARPGSAGASGEGVSVSRATRRGALTGWQERRPGAVR